MFAGVAEATQLTDAIKEGNKSEVIRLLQDGADPNEEDASTGLTPLQLAQHYDYQNHKCSEIPELLKEYGAF